MSSNSLTLPEIELAYLEAGDPAAPLALCLHGFPDSAHGFDKLLPALAAAGWHAVAPWMRGYAPSAIPENGDYEVGTLGADAVAMIKALGNDRTCVLIGHDWGASAVYAACNLAPDLVDRALTMALMHPLGFGPQLLMNYAQQKRSFYMFLFQMQGMAEMVVSANDMAFIDNLIADWSPDWNRTETQKNQLREAIGDPQHLSAALGYYRSALQPGGGGGAQAAQRRAKATAPVATPTKLLMGTADGCIGPDAITDQSPFFTGEFTLEMIEGAGHFMLEDRTEEVVEKILDWIGTPSV